MSNWQQIRYEFNKGIYYAGEQGLWFNRKTSAFVRFPDGTTIVCELRIQEWCSEISIPANPTIQRVYVKFEVYGGVKVEVEIDKVEIDLDDFIYHECYKKIERNEIVIKTNSEENSKIYVQGPGYSFSL